MNTAIVSCWILSMSIIGIFMFINMKNSITQNRSLIQVANCRLENLINRREENKKQLKKERSLIIEHQRIAHKELEESRKEVKFFEFKLNDLRKCLKEGVTADEAETISCEYENYKCCLAASEKDCKKWKQAFASYSRILQKIDDRLSA